MILAKLDQALRTFDERWLAERLDVSVGTIRLWKRGAIQLSEADERDILRMIEAGLNQDVQKYRWHVRAH